MKKKFILTPFIAALIYIVLAGNATGPGATSGVEGTGVTAAGCSCHNATSTSSTNVVVQLYDATGTTQVTNYVAGGSYKIRVTGTQTDGSLTLPRFGFQVSAMAGTSTTANAGTLSAITGTHTSSPAGVNIVEHSAPIAATTGSGGSGTTYVVSIPWAAPAAGTGNVTLRSVINAVNFDGTDGPQDKWNTGAAVMPELAAITGTASVCISGTTSLGNAVSGGTWSTTSSNININATSGLVTGVTAGTAAVTYTAGGNFVTRVVNINANPGPITGTLSVCQGQTTILGNSVSGGVWSSTSSNVSVSGPNVTGVNAGNAVVTYAIGTCSVTATVVVNPLAANTGTLSVCQSSNTQLSNINTGGTWTSGTTGVGTVNASNGLVTGIATGTTNITYSLPTGCNSISTVAVNTQPSAIGGPSEVCVASSVTATSAPAGGTWSGSGGMATIDATTGVISATSTGNYNVTYTSPGGCFATGVVTVNALPAAILGGFSGVCAGSNITVTSGTSGGTWTSGNTGIATIGVSGILTGVSVTGGTAPISYTLSTGCRRVTNVNVIAISPISGNLNICPGQTTSLSSGPAGGTWSGGVAGIATINASTGLVSGIAAGTAGVTYTSTTCSVNAVVNVGSLPAITGGTGVCVGATLALSNTTSGGTWTSSTTSVGTVDATTGLVAGIASGTTTISYTTSGGCATSIVVAVAATPGAVTTAGGGTFCGSTTITASGGTGGTIYFQGTTSGGTSTTTPSTSQLISTSGTYYFRVRSAGGCWGSEASVAVVINAVPAAITGNIPLCIGSSATLSSAPTGGTWLSASGSVATVGLSTGLVNATGSGTTTITYIATGGCQQSVIVTVNPNPAAVTGTANVCAGATRTFSSTPAGGTWASSNTGIFTVAAGTGIVTGVSANTATLTYALSTGCFATADITVNPAAPAITGGGSPICMGASVTLNDATTGGTWTSSNSSIGGVNATSGVVNGAGAGTVIITYSLPTGCAATTIVSVNALPTAITGVSGICLGLSSVLSSTPAGGTWSSNDPLILTIGITSGGIMGAGAGTTVVTYMATTGCIITKVVSVNPQPTNITGTASVCIGTTATLGSTPAGGTWTSANTGIATVNASTGVVTGVATGNTNISYTLSTGCNTTTIATVSAAATAGTITGSASVCTGLTISLADAVNGGTWASSSANATVSSSGVVTGVTAGTAMISYTVITGCGTVVATKLITVTTTATAGTLAGPFTTCLGTNGTLSSSVTGGTWLSNNTAVSAIGSSTGIYTGASTGTALITYTISSACGTASATATVTVNALPAAIGGSALVCEGGTATLTDATGTWASSNTGVAGIGLSSGIVTGVSGGTSVITFTDGSTGCTAIRIMTVNALPAAIGGTLAICNGSSTTLNSLPAGGTWSGSDGAIAFVSAATGLVAGLAQGTSIISYTLGTGCARPAVLTVNPVPAAISGTFSLCAGTSTTLANTTNNGTWASGNVPVATIASTTGLLNGVAAGTSVISYILPTGCRATVTVSVNALPSAIGGTPSVCVGSSTTLTDAPSGGTWTSANTGIASVGAASGAVLGVGAGQATITYTSAAGCTRTINVTVNDMPSAITGTRSVCVGLTTTLASTTTGGTWTSGSASIATAGASTGVITGIAAATSTVSYTLSTGCAVSAIVTVNALPGTITGTLAVCAGAATTLGSTPAGGTWASGNASAATISATGVVSAIAAGTSVITYTSATGCVRTATLSVNAAPQAISGASSLCAGTTTTLADAITGGTWASSTAANAAVNSATGVVTGVAAGTATITYTLSTGCSATKVVTVNALPVISGPAAVCSGADITLTGSIVGGTWISSATGIATINSASGILHGVAAGTANITNTTPAGCTSVHAVTVNPLPDPGTITGAASVCVGAHITMADAVTGGSWSMTNGSATISSTGVVTGVAEGVDTILYTVTTTCGIVGAAQIVSVNPLPQAAAISGTATLCAGSATSLSPSVTGGTWSGSNAAIATVNVTSGIVNGITGGTAIITYTVTNSCGTAATNYEVTVNPLPDAGTITGVDSVCEGMTITLSSLAAGGIWSSSSAANATVNAAGEVAGLAAGTVTISYAVTNTCGTATAIMQIRIRSAAECASRVDPLSAGKADGMMVYPDPNNGSFTVALPQLNDKADIAIMDMLGKVICTRSVSGNDIHTTFELNVAPGNYVVKVNAGGQVYRAKITIK